MNNEKNTVDLAVSPDVVEFASKTTLDKFNNTVLSATISNDLYVKNLPEELTLDIVKGVNDYNAKYIKAAGDIAATVGVEALKKDKNVDVVNFKLPYMGDGITPRSSKLEVAVHRDVPAKMVGNVEVPGGAKVLVKVINKADTAHKNYFKTLNAQVQEQLTK